MYHNGALRRDHNWQEMKYVGGSRIVEACSCSVNQDISCLYWTRRNMSPTVFLLSLSCARWIHYIFPCRSDILSFLLCVGLPNCVQLRLFSVIPEKKNCCSVFRAFLFAVCDGCGNRDGQWSLRWEMHKKCQPGNPKDRILTLCVKIRWDMKLALWMYTAAEFRRAAP